MTKQKQQAEKGWETPSQRKYWDTLKGVKNEKAPHWKGNNIGKDAIHYWLEVNYGKESFCENPNCEGKSKIFEWCKKRECNYERKRNSFMRLCRSCHRRYDLTTDKLLQAVKNLWWYKNEK